jgi:hypothetical protein
MWVYEEDMTSDWGEAYIEFGDHNKGWLGIMNISGKRTEGSQFYIHFAVGAIYDEIIEPLKILFSNKIRGRWVFYAMTYKDGWIATYQDGENKGSIEQEIFIWGDNAAIGRHWWDSGRITSSRFVGAVDEVKIFSKALSDDDIGILYDPPCTEDGLIAYWSFDDETCKDHSGNSYHGTPMNNPTYVDGINGGKAIYLTGKNSSIRNNDDVSLIGSHVLLPKIPFDLHDEFTIAMWVKEDELSFWIGEAYIFFGYHTFGWLGIFNHVIQDFNDDIRRAIFSVGSENWSSVIQKKADSSFINTWSHYCLNYCDGTLRAYINGDIVGEKEMEIDIFGNYCAIGRHWWNNLSFGYTSARFTGAIDEVKIFCKCLDPKDFEPDLAGCGEDRFHITKFDDSNTKLIGDARFRDDHVRLTESRKRLQGAIWYNQYVDINNGFETVFRFRVPEGDQGTCDPDGSLPGADGFAFVIQNESRQLNARGETDWGLGYKGIENSVAVEFDLYKNDDPVNDPNGNHVAVQTNRQDGNVPYHTFTHCLSMKDDIMEIKPDGTEYYAKIDYNREPNTLRIFISKDDNFDHLAMAVPNFRLEDYIDLNNGKAIIGFTASTGDAWEAHDILEWSYCPFIGCTPYEPEIMMVEDGPVCEGDTIKLRTTEEFESYEWSDGTNSREMIATESGTYNVTVLDEEGCPGTGTIFLFFNPRPDPEITVTGRKVLCEGDSVILRTQEGFSEYQWREEIMSSILSSNNELIVKRRGKYYVYVENEAGCWAISEMVKIVFSDMMNGLQILGLSSEGIVEFDPTHFPEVLCKDISIKNIAEEEIILENAYTFMNTEFSVPASQFPIHIPAGETINLQVCYSPQKLGEARDTLSIEDFCNTQYIPLHGICPANTHIGDSRCDVRTELTTTELPEKGLFSASPPVPNPSTGIIELDYIISNEQNVSIRITNSMGININPKNISQSVEYYNESIQSVSSSIDLSDQPSGIYFINLTNDRDVFVFNVSLCK